MARRDRRHRLDRDLPQQRVKRGFVALLGEEIGDRLRDDRPDALDRREFLRCAGAARRGPQMLPVAEMARQPARVRLADAADAERVQEPVQRDRPARVDRFEEIAHGDFAEPLPFAQGWTSLPVAGAQGEDVGGGADHTFLEEELDLLVAEPLDVEGVARAEMLQPLYRLGRADEKAGAAPHHIDLAGLLVDLAQSRRAANGTGLRKFERLRIRLALL